MWPVPVLEIREEDEARLSPLVYSHINVLGHYSFTLAEQVMNGQLRPLNQISVNLKPLEGFFAHPPGKCNKTNLGVF
jgi:hypothetical protein